MANFLIVPKATSYDDSSFVISGNVLYTVPGTPNRTYRVAYYSPNDYVITVGCYRSGSKYNFVFYAGQSIDFITIKVATTNEYDNTILSGSLTAITTRSRSGYYGVITVSPDSPIIPITVYNTLDEALIVMGDWEEEGGGGGGSSDNIIFVNVSRSSGEYIDVNVSSYVEGADFIDVNVDATKDIVNPYGPGGDSIPGQGGGTFDNPTDPISLPDLPSHGVTDFIKLWNPSSDDMVRLTELLFTGNIFTQAIRDLIGQPIDYIVSLGIVPVPLSIGGVSVPFKLAHQDAGFNMYGVTQQYMRWSCGSVLVPLYWNNFLDFEPHTSIQLYLPFIGFRDVLPSDIVGKTVSITYHLDVFTGACVAYVANEDTILYQYNGTCLSPIPFAAEQMQNLVSGFVGLLGSAATAGAVLTGGFAAGIAKSILAGSAIGAASSVLSLPEHKTQHGGNAGSTVGLLSSRKPYFVLNRPRQAVASAQGTYSGFATWYTVESFGQLDGYTQVAECHLHDIPATDWELQEIERLLKEGAIF